MTDSNVDLAVAEDIDTLDRDSDDDASLELHARNLKAFSQYEPRLHSLLSNYKPHSSLIYSDDGEPDIELKGVKLYEGKGAYTVAKAQLENYWQAPKRVIMNLLDSNALDEHANKFASALIGEASQAGVKFHTNPATYHSYFVIVLGVGLGPHINELVEKTNCQHLILIEPSPEFLYHSTFVFDWAALYEKLGDKKKVTIIISSSPKHACSAVQGTIRTHNPSGLDGTFFYTHYNNAILKKTEDDLRGGSLETGMMGLGFFEDELNMISQTFENLRDGKARMIATQREKCPLPVFIVGNGPSLDGVLPVIEENKDKAVVIACGSALDPLMKNGIVPDFVALLERAPDLLTFYEMTAKAYDLSKICLVGGSNLYPGVKDLFGDAILFFRPGISPRPLFARKPEQSPPRPDPLVANAALAFSISAGFTEFYFFGVDVGAKEADYHHSKSSWYSTKGMKYNFKFDRSVPGNFGGTVLTTSVLKWSKSSLEGSLLSGGGGKRYYNCSDGAWIDGALPKHPSTVSLPDANDKEAVVNKLRERFPVYTKDDFEAAWTEADIYSRLDSVRNELVECLDDTEIVDMEYMTDMMTILKPSNVEDPVAMIYRGSVYFMLMVLYSYSMRINSGEDQDIFNEIAQRVFGENMAFLRDQATEKFKAVEDRTVDWSLDEDGKPKGGG